MIKSRLNFIKPIDNKHLKEVGDYKWIYKSFHSGDRVAGHEYIDNDKWLVGNITNEIDT